MAASTQAKQQPHAVCVPFPAQGHINPMLKMAILLHHKGFHITFVNTEHIHNRLLKTRGPTLVEGLPDFQFATIPDGLPSAESVDTSQNIPELCQSTSKSCLGPLNELISELNNSSQVPPVSCLLTDAAMTFALDAAEKVGVPGVLLRTASAARFMCQQHFKSLVEKGIVPLKDESYLTNGYLEETIIDWVPGVIPLRLKDFSSFVQTTDIENVMLNFTISESVRSLKSSAIIMNTFDDLEHNVLSSMSSNFPPVYAIGPLNLLFDQLIPETNNLKCLSSSLWKEEPECLQWLDTKPKSSVIYVNFGSITVITAEQLNEFALGLAESKKNFLWIVRPDLVQGIDATLPAEYWEEIGGRGFVVGWCPQEKVLNHPAVGGFLTHCGWNSTMESLCSGVPMLCWPFFADQHINCRYACDEWGVGMEIDGSVKREEVGTLVKELLDGENGQIMKDKAMKWKEKIAKAISSTGSSYLNLEKLVGEVLAI